MGLGATTGALALLHASGSRSTALEVTVLTVANLAVTVLRFVAMKLWVFVRAAPAVEPEPVSAAVPGSPAASPTGAPAARRD